MKEVARDSGEFEGEGALLALDDDWGDENAGPQPADEASKGLVIAFGQTLKKVREREGVDRPTLGKAIGYSPATVASYEQGRRIPSGLTIDTADNFLHANGLLSVWKEQMERAQYPAFFQGMAALEKKAIELLSYSTLVFHGLLQTEEYMRAMLAMRRPSLDPEIIEQRVAARLARQRIFDRWPAPLLTFVLDEAVLLRPYGGKDVLRGQLEHVLLLGTKRDVQIQVMPLSCEDNAGVNGPFTVVTRTDGKRFVYSEIGDKGSLQTDTEQAALSYARYGIIRSQALSPRESTKSIEGVLGSL